MSIVEHLVAYKHPFMTARLTFAKNLKLLRIQKGLSQEALAELCDLHRTYVSSVERGERNITVDNMERLAIALGVNITELLSNHVNKKP
jgi:transcriptional regulator with XRE-family HTH domain